MRAATAASGGAAATSGAKSRPDQRAKEGGDLLVVKQHETGGWTDFKVDLMAKWQVDRENYGLRV